MDDPLEKLVPAAFVAVTVNVYDCPFDRPLTTHSRGPDVHAHCSPLGDEVTVYAVIGTPPLSVGAVQLTWACVLPAWAVTDVGTPGVVRGITLDEAALDEPLPAALVAMTVKV